MPFFLNEPRIIELEAVKNFFIAHRIIFLNYNLDFKSLLSSIIRIEWTRRSMLLHILIHNAL